jgi:hypothetical protein
MDGETFWASAGGAPSSTSGFLSALAGIHAIGAADNAMITPETKNGPSIQPAWMHSPAMSGPMTQPRLAMVSD